MNNFAHIKAMSVDKLAKFLEEHLLGHHCNADKCVEYDGDCFRCIKKFLVSEVDNQ